MKIKQMEKALETCMLVVVDTGYKAGGSASYVDIDRVTQRQREQIEQSENEITFARTYGPKIATILAVRQPRKVYSGRSFIGHTSNTGVLVQYEDGSTETVKNTDVIEELNEYRRIAKLVAERKQNEQQHAESHKQRTAAAVASLQELLRNENGELPYGSVQARSSYDGRRYSTYQHIELSTAAAEKLVALLSQ